MALTLTWTDINIGMDIDVDIEFDVDIDIGVHSRCRSIRVNRVIAAIWGFKFEHIIPALPSPPTRLRAWRVLCISLTRKG